MPRASRLRLFRTTAFNLTAVFLAVFTVFAAFLIGYVARNTTAILQAQVDAAVETELAIIREQYLVGGLGRVADFVELRGRQPDASLYLLTGPDGVKIAGNVETVPDEVLVRSDSAPRVVPYVRLGEDNAATRHAALVRVVDFPGGARILVGRDITDHDALIAVVRRALVLTAALTVALGLAAWIFVSRRVLRRIDSIADATRRFAAGDLSGRLDVTGTRDEFDRLAESLNAMLMRIERLMLGLKEVSDNIAHDLKTPLTRMRNRVERALAQARTEAEYREVLQATIEETDQLIRTFNALLMIARAEAGASDAGFALFDAAEVARDVYELYEPLAEQAGVTLKLHSDTPVMVRANRELISQALANLVDNAIKYAGDGDRRPEVTIAVGLADGVVDLRVADNGRGITAAERIRVTERFVRLEEGRSKPGAGLGLSLVSAVARLHGGELVMADNTPGLAASLHVPSAAPGRAA